MKTETLKKLRLEAFDRAFREGLAEDLTIYRTDRKDWVVTLQSVNPHSGTKDTYTLLTQRGKVRTWKDATRLIHFLEQRYAITAGRYDLSETIDLGDK